MTTCAICTDVMSENSFVLAECGHRFHTNCIMTWFRTGRSSCPLCNHEPPSAVFTWYDRYKAASRVYKQRHADAQLVSLFESLHKAKHKKKRAEQSLETFRDSQSTGTNRALIRKFSSINSRLTRHRMSVLKLKRIIAEQATKLTVFVEKKQICTSCRKAQKN